MLQMNFVSDTRKTAHTNIVTRKYVIMNHNKYIYKLWMTVFCLCIFCRAVTYGDVSYDYMPETFATLEEKRNKFAFDKDKGKYV